ncbi:hypothetical protein jhhlp_006481 [Lomentospora prolificans]|uniref:RIC1 C-terminal alpha solenoid region domain-containing protein n=1 Tax=Lomentospora prolificans TaxID=41688 RepID=A0A2N3N5Z5_9PEZI|nr:hypothetical protein jhhlp_006481 [Lomentospora prolificans]
MHIKDHRGLEPATMYWPVGTPKAFATRNNIAPASIYVAHEQPSDIASPSGPGPSDSLQTSNLWGPATLQEDPKEPLPKTPITPITPAVRSIEHEYLEETERGPVFEREDVPETLSTKEPVLALKVSRTGHIFAVITSTTMTIWQTKPTAVLAMVVRSETSLATYGKNIDVLLRPDSAIIVIRTGFGYLITYSIATDPDARVYRPHFHDYHNVQKRRQNHTGSSGGYAPDQILWGPGEGVGIKDVSVRFRMVIKVDAGIESALALDDELVVATSKPTAIQCIRWSPDSNGKQTRTEILSRMNWLDKKTSVVQMTYDKPMGLMTWVTADGRAYAVQRHHSLGAASNPPEPEAKRLFKGHCFHEPENAATRALQAVINARFSLIAVGCEDGVVRVYSAKDYSGNIPASHTHSVPVSSSLTGKLTTLTYSPDGYCLFAGFEKGWATWSVYGKTGSHSFGVDHYAPAGNESGWLAGVSSASWIGGSTELLMTNKQNDTVWVLEMARSAVSSCYTASNIFRTVLQTSTSVLVYRGYDLPDLTTISAEPFLWHTAKIPSLYLQNQWPIKCTVISPDGRYVAVAGRRGLAHYSVNSGRWKTFSDPVTENEFQVKGGMCWYQHILIAAVEANKSYELRLYSRETPLDGSHALHIERIPAPIVLVISCEEDSVLVYTQDNLLHHFILTPVAGSIHLVQVGQIAFHGIVRSPARVRGLTWILPEQHLAEGDPSQDVTVASVLFLVDGKLVILRPSMSEEGNLKYDMKVISQNVEFHANMRDEPFCTGMPRQLLDDNRKLSTVDAVNLRHSLWVFDGNGLKVWSEIQDVLDGISAEHSRAREGMIYIPTDFYPLSMLLDKAIILGVESELVQRRDVTFSFFRFDIRTHLFLSDMLRHYLSHDMKTEAIYLAQQYESLEYFPHALEILLHNVLDDEVDASPSPEDAILPRVLSLLSSFKEYLDIVLQCTRKTEVRQWKTLFAYLPPVQELFEESLQRGSLKTAGGYLLILHTLEETESVSEQSVRLFSRAIKEQDWELCKELARFLAALDETGMILGEAMESIKTNVANQGNDDSLET